MRERVCLFNILIFYSIEIALFTINLLKFIHSFITFLNINLISMKYPRLESFYCYLIGVVKYLRLLYYYFSFASSIKYMIKIKAVSEIAYI